MRVIQIKFENIIDIIDYIYNTDDKKKRNDNTVCMTSIE